jgi:XrtJ-associated TM-motif-TM protein
LQSPSYDGERHPYSPFPFSVPCIAIQPHKELNLKISRYLPPVMLLLSFAVRSAHAQGGCTDSPEASTDVLMLVGSVGMVHGSLLLKRLVQRVRSR